MLDPNDAENSNRRRDHGAIRPDARCERCKRLRRIASAIGAGLAPDRGDLAWLADVIDRILAGEPADVALGLKTKPGQRTWRTSAALAERDQIFKEAARRFLAGRSLAEQAHRLSIQLSYYHATAWQRERASDLCPDRHLGTIREFLWRGLKARDRALSERSLRQVLAAS